MLTGGGAMNVALRKAIERRIGYGVLVSPEPLLTGAMGVAILGRELALKAIERGVSWVETRKRRQLDSLTSFFSVNLSRHDYCTIRYLYFLFELSIVPTHSMTTRGQIEVINGN